MPYNQLNNQDYWKLPADKILEKLDTKFNGLSEKEVSLRQKKYGLNIIHKRKVNILSILLRQITSNPLIMILATATFISFVLGQHISSYYIFGMIILSIFLGFWNDFSAERTIGNLLKKISQTALVIREDDKKEIPVSQLIIGDVVLLSQGTIIPADLRLVETKNLGINQSLLTGETKTIYKNSDPVLKTNSSFDIANLAFMGTSVESGFAKGIVIKIGKETEFGKIAKSVTFIKPTTEFQKGLASFGNLIVRVIIILAIVIFGVNAFLGHKLIESLLFSLAIAVGLTPELLPVIVTVSLSHGAGKLAKKYVVAKRLISIENLGNMDVLCTDKTGTITEGKIQVVDYNDINGRKDNNLLIFSLLCNSAIVHHKIIGNGIDVALWDYALKNNINVNNSFAKITEEPFDYVRKAMYSVISNKGKMTLIAKGAPDTIIPLCDNVANGKIIREKILSLNNDGLRVVALATKTIPNKKSYSWNDVKSLKFQGYLTFLDTPKSMAREALLRLTNLSVSTKIVTGDNEIVTKKICKEVGMEIKNIILGSQIDNLSDDELKNVVNETEIFARVNPQQKLRVIQALRNNGHTVGYLGDGVNDIPSLHGADVGISVNTAIDVAKDTASIVLLHKSLNVIADGIIEGRKTFSNTIKYILMGTSSNFGNMFSAAGASFFLPFLPMLPVQILLTNGLYDISQMTIPSDNVDQEYLIKPRHWNIGFIKKYMLFFGPLSSVYDFLTFGVMFYVFNAKDSLFQTGWFIESVATEILVVFVIRTARTPFFTSRPGKWLLITCLGIVGVAIIIPFTSFANNLGFVSPPPLYFGILILLVGTYLLLVESVKNIFLKRFSL